MHSNGKGRLDAQLLQAGSTAKLGVDNQFQVLTLTRAAMQSSTWGMSVSLMSDPICMLMLPELWLALLTVLTRPDQAGCAGDDLGTALFRLTAAFCTAGEALATHCQLQWHSARSAAQSHVCC